MPPPPTPGTPITRYRDGRKARPGAVGMLLEGDSWFAFPMWLRTNIVAELKRTFQDRIVQLNLSASGDEAREMLCGKQFARLYRVMAEERLTFDGILFSGGGNDIVATNLPVLLRQYEAGMTWEDCLNMPRFTRRLQEIEHAYEDLADLRDDYQEQAWIITHGYDYAIPSGKGVRILGLKAAGGWLQKIMKTRDIPARIQQELLNHMLARFDDMLIRLSQSHRNWEHVRTQGTLRDSEWADEMHPTSAGFKKITVKFQETLCAVFPKLKRS
jgi:hypothetical protein